MFVVEPSVLTTLNEVEILLFAVNILLRKRIIVVDDPYLLCIFLNFSRHESRGVFVNDV